MEFKLKKACGKHTRSRKATQRKYSIVLSYSKQVIDLPPFPPGNGGYQGRMLCITPYRRHHFYTLRHLTTLIGFSL